MARHRTIKPEFFSSEQVVACSTTARLLFVGLLCFSDDGGVHPASAARLKMEVFPAGCITASDVAGCIEELISSGLVESYVVDGKEFWRVTGWHHQRIDKPSYIYPRSREFGEQAASVRRVVVERSPPEAKGSEGKRGEANGEEGKSKSDRKAIGKSTAAAATARTLSPRSPLNASGGGEEEPIDLADVNWDHVVAMAEDVARKIPPMSEDDRRMWLRFAVLAEVRWSENWLMDSVEAVMRATSRRGSPQAHFVGVVKSKAVEDGVAADVFLGIIRRLEIPKAIWKSSVLEVQKRA